MPDSALSSPWREALACLSPRAVFVCVLLTSLLSGCGTPSRAPVEARGSPIDADTYEVRRGDTLWSIAWRAGLDYRQVADWNRLPPPYTIYPGQRLRLTPPYGPPDSGPRRVVRTTASRPPARVDPPRALGQSRSDSRPEPGPKPERASKSEPSSKSNPPSRPNPASKAERPRSSRVRAVIKPEAKSAPAAASAGLRWQWPTKGKVVRGFADGDATRKGLRITGRIGQAIVAAESGNVVYSGSGLIGYGRLIIIKHNTDYLSAYGYNRKILVREGDQVTRGDRIAEMGRIGGNAPMLHFEIRRRGKPVDPAEILPPR